MLFMSQSSPHHEGRTGSSVGCRAAQHIKHTPPQQTAHPRAHPNPFHPHRLAIPRRTTSAGLHFRLPLLFLPVRFGFNTNDIADHCTPPYTHISAHPHPQTSAHLTHQSDINTSHPLRRRPLFSPLSPLHTHTGQACTTLQQPLLYSSGRLAAEAHCASITIKI